MFKEKVMSAIEKIKDTSPALTAGSCERVNEPADDADEIKGERCVGAVLLEKRSPELFAVAKSVMRDCLHASNKSQFWWCIEKLFTLEAEKLDSALRMLRRAPGIDKEVQSWLLDALVQFVRKYNVAEIERFAELAFEKFNGRVSDYVLNFWIRKGPDYFLKFDEETAFIVNMMLMKCDLFDDCIMGELIIEAGFLIADHGLETFYRLIRDPLFLRDHENRYYSHFKYIKKFGLESYFWICGIGLLVSASSGNYNCFVSFGQINLPAGIDYYKRAGADFIRLLPESISAIERSGLIDYKRPSIYGDDAERPGLEDTNYLFAPVDDLRCILLLERTIVHERYGETAAARLYDINYSVSKAFVCNFTYWPFDPTDSVFAFITRSADIFDLFGPETLERAAGIFIRYSSIDVSFACEFLNNINEILANYDDELLDDLAAGAFGSGKIFPATAGRIHIHLRFSSPPVLLYMPFPKEPAGRRSGPFLF